MVRCGARFTALGPTGCELAGGVVATGHDGSAGGGTAFAMLCPHCPQNRTPWAWGVPQWGQDSITDIREPSVAPFL